MAGVHPQNKMPGTYTQVPYCKKTNAKEVCTFPLYIIISLSFLHTHLQNVLLGPGAYYVGSGDFDPQAVSLRARGPNWERAYDLAKFHAIPHMLYKERWEHKKELVSPSVLILLLLLLLLSSLVVVVVVICYCRCHHLLLS